MGKHAKTVDDDPVDTELDADVDEPGQGRHRRTDQDTAKTENSG